MPTENGVAICVNAHRESGGGPRGRPGAAAGATFRSQRQRWSDEGAQSQHKSRAGVSTAAAAGEEPSLLRAGASGGRMIGVTTHDLALRRKMNDRYG